MGVQTLIVRNMSGHDQLFQVHGWNNNQDIVVGPNSESRIGAADGSSGAIIAIHDGQIGEQAEITKCGFGGNDFIDMSNFCGAGGNMIVQQVGENNTRKGDPRLRQILNDAWQRADEGTRKNLQQCVFLRDGHVARIAAPKDFPQLENFVRSFADGKTYIGVSAWGGSPGNADDNAQSSAANGSKDILICYNDGDCTPHDDAPVTVAQTHGEIETEAPTEPVMNNFFVASADGHGPGILLTNKSNKEIEYFFYDKFWTGDGTAGANFEKPLKCVKLQPNDTQFVSLPNTFKGRVQRDMELPCIWIEFQLDASNDHRAHGDISLQQGHCFDFGIVSGAPDAAIRNKPNGERATDTTAGSWNGGPNQATIDYLNQIVGQTKAYILGGSGIPDVASGNKQLAVVMY